jgi:DNA phosphorothioation-dependent restriction protein DptG
MNPESWGFIGTLVGAIVGASASIFTTRINSDNAIQIQKNIEKSARKERYREFQRDNFLELQEKLSNGMRLVCRAFFEDFENYKKTNNWKTSMLPHELDQEIGNCFRELSLKTERVDENELRNEIISLKNNMADFLLVKTSESAERKLRELTDTFQKVMPKLGKALRENY